MSEYMKKANTHIVIKRQDALKYLTEVEYKALEQMLLTISQGRNKDGKKPINTYYVCNIDEPYAEVVHGIIIGGEAVKEQNLSNKQERLVTSDEDCADCLCRVCARNAYNDSYNHKLENGGKTCTCNCKPSDTLVETEDDCPKFLPDED